MPSAGLSCTRPERAPDLSTSRESSCAPERAAGGSLPESHRLSARSSQRHRGTVPRNVTTRDPPFRRSRSGQLVPSTQALNSRAYARADSDSWGPVPVRDDLPGRSARWEMTDRKLSWGLCKRDEDRLSVPVDPPADENWRLAFGLALGMIDRPVLARHYAGHQFVGQLLVLTGVRPGPSRATALLFDSVVAQANRELARQRRDRARLARGTAQPACTEWRR